MSAELPQAVAAQTFSGNGPAQVTQPVRLVDTQTGEVIERLPVIAREIIACNNGRFIYEGEPMPPAPAPAGDDTPAPLPKVGQLAAAIAALDVDAVSAMQARDTRANAAPIYAARLAEIEQVAGQTT
jgi:hypothetical protein